LPATYRNFIKREYVESIVIVKIKNGEQYKMRLFSLRILLILSLVIGFGSVHSVWAETSSDASPGSINLAQWAGQDFTFLPLTAVEDAGYDIYTEDQAAQGFRGDRSVRIPYAEHVGKRVTVTQIAAFPAGENIEEYMVHMTVNDTGEKLVGRTMHGQLGGLVLTADLDNARQKFLGKTVYPKFRQLAGVYVDGVMQPAVTTKIGSPVTVLEIYAGNQSQEPIGLLVSVNGTKAILPLAYSWTNSPVTPWTQSAPWEEALFMENPRVTFGGSEDLWKQIETGNIAVGMNKGQVRLSWGKPFQSEENDSVWIYGTDKLIFDGDTLQSIEARPVSPLPITQNNIECK
jgi:hypothetical protein